MKRREFIKSSLVVTSSVSFFNSCGIKEDLNNKNHLSGFIFSDAHIGWKGESQPSIEAQKQAIQTIKSEFPLLDLVFDTGDIHHGYLNENERNVARDHWLSGFSNPFSKTMFHYVPGNHELGKGPTDTEITATKLGSQNLRPYYSFDYKGIHFISLPQLSDTILINRESLDWLDFDLSMNREKTTLILSHNSLSGTTYNDNQTGYRTVANSEDVFKIIDNYPNMIAWLHGHNHQYEIVNKNNRLFVSNGRIGGYNPPKSWGDFGQGHLGGIFFSINRQGIVIKCYSATHKDFLYNLGYKNLSNKLEFETSFNNSSETNYYYGHGALTNNVEHEITNHYHSSKDICVFTRPVINEVLNDNSDMQIPTDLYFANNKIKRLVGYELFPKNLKRETVATGLYIENKSDEYVSIKLPRHSIKKDDFMIRGSYFRCELGDSFTIKLYFDLRNRNTQNESVVIKYYIYDEFHNLILEPNSYTNNLIESRSIERIINIPLIKEIKNGTRKYIRFSMTFKNFPTEFIVKKIELSKTVIDDKKSELIINKNSYKPLKTEITKIPVRDFQAQGRSKLKYKGKTPICCIIKVQDVLWQIRNAVSELNKNSIELIEYRHQYQKVKEVVLVPTKKFNIYLNKVTDIMPLKIVYKEGYINIQFYKINSHSKLSFIINIEPKKIIGAKTINTSKNKMEIIPEIKNIKIWF